VFWGGNPPWAGEQDKSSVDDVLDWRVLALVAAALSVAFTLITIGIKSTFRNGFSDQG